MFEYESQMTRFAQSWLESQGMMTKAEFATPWGICDLVGCLLDKSQVKKRLGHGQTKPVASQLRMMILDLIPDVENKESISPYNLKNHFSEFFNNDRLDLEISRLVKGKFVIKTSQNTLQKLNGWMPLQKKIVALELKLNRVKEALHQTVNNLGFADESYVGFPIEIAKRVVDGNKKNDFSRNGIGILGISMQGCKILVKSDSAKSNPDKIMQAHCVERFWRNYPKDIAS